MPILGITRSVWRCSDAIVMRWHHIRPIRISRIGSIQIIRDDIPPISALIPIEMIRFRQYRYTVRKRDRSGILDFYYGFIVFVRVYTLKNKEYMHIGAQILALTRHKLFSSKIPRPALSTPSYGSEYPKPIRALGSQTGARASPV